MLITRLILFYFYCIANIHGKHFNGGTITWAPIDPYATGTSVSITITQTYYWNFPYIKCLTNVPVSSGFSSSTLICTADCLYDGGYSTKKISTSTDCISTSPALSMMTSQRSNNITLNKDAHFYLAYVGEAWVPLNYPVRRNQEWSIVTYIDLRVRSDGFINTPPVATVVSPQYAIVNRTIQITIPVSDVNAGDDVRCRWSTYTDGYRRRKRSGNEKQFPIRKKRSCAGYCSSNCFYGCSCSDCSSCSGAAICGATSTTVATTTAATTISTTTIETTGTLRSTSSYSVRQAINECADVCYPDSLPSGTTLNGCTISFTGTRANTWYAVAIQVEDFMNSTSTTAMSSVPVQLLIYVMGEPSCSKQPLILPLDRCLEVQVGVQISFDIYAMNLCNPAISNVADIVPSGSIDGMTKGNLTKSPTNSSLSYVRFTWTPQANQVGYVEQCTTAYTTEQVQSNQYCVIFTVKTTSELCVTTTTTSTTTTTETTTTTTTSSSTTTTTSTTTTETTTTTTTSTTTTTTTSSTTTTTTSTTTTTTTTTTSTTTTSTTTTSTTTTTTTSTTTSTTTTTSTSTTSTTTTSTTTTTTSVTTTTVTTATTTTTLAPNSIKWPLIVGLSLLAFLLSLCCCAYCLYRYCWLAGKRRHHRKKECEVGIQEQRSRATSRLFRANSFSKPNNDYNSLHTIDTASHTLTWDLTMTDMNSEKNDITEQRPNSMVSMTRVKCIDTEDNQSVHVTKVSKLDKIQEDIQQVSSDDKTKTVHADIKKISRKKTAGSTFKIHPVANRSKTASHHTRLDDGVTVKKLSRTVTSAQT